MITTEAPPNSPELPTLIRTLYQVCNKLNNCLPVHILPFIANLTNINKYINLIIISGVGKNNLESNISYTWLLTYFTKFVRQSSQAYQSTDICYRQNQIQLKLYYQHLEDVISNLKKQRDHNCEVIGSLQTELSVLKDKQKFYLMTTSNNNTRHNEDAHVETKLDTFTKIKNRLSLNGTQEFYTSYLAKRMEKESDTKQLRDKRQSLASALKQLYESPVQNKQQSRKQHKILNKSKPKPPPDKQKSKSKQHTNSNHTLNKSKSRRSLNNSQKSTQRQRPAREPSRKVRQKQDKDKDREKGKQKDYLKQTISNISSRRNSKS